MPELPETETIARDLNALVSQAVIVSVEVLRADVLRGVTAELLAERVVDARIVRVWRRAKLIVIDLAGGNASYHLVVQPRFTGALLVDDGSLPDALRDYLAISFVLADGRLLHYRDVRRLGTVACMSSDEFERYTARLGPEPLDSAFTAARLQRVFAHTQRPIKAALMDQTLLAGVGNIYASEALWAAGIDPSRVPSSLGTDEWESLHSALQRILTASIAARGTSFRDYRDARGEQGEYVAQLTVYGRAGEPCHRCGKALIGTQAIDGRSTVFCAWCQR